MKKLFIALSLAAFALGAQAQYQIPNSTFEENFITAYYNSGWLSTTEYTEPRGWHGYATLSGSNATLGRDGSKLFSSSDVRPTTLDPTSTSTKSACIKATYKVITIANGVMTTGRICSNSTSATDGTKNYNFSTIGNTDTSNGNTNSNFYQSFTGRPDAMKVWVKFDPKDATKSSDYPYASVSAYLHTNGGTMYDPTDNLANDEINVAHASNTEIANYGNWHQLDVPFVYNNTNDPAAILVTFTTNAQPGQGTDGDLLYIDDIEMIYNSEIKSASYNGVPITLTAGLTTNVDAYYEANKLSLTSNGYAASIARNYNKETGLLTIVVSGDNVSDVPSNKHTYYIQFNVSNVVTTDSYVDDLLVKVNETALDVLTTEISVNRLESGRIHFALHNFILWQGGSPQLPVGNIDIYNLPLSGSEDGSYDTFSYDGIQNITVGDEGYMLSFGGSEIPVPSSAWKGPGLGDIPLKATGKITDNLLYVTININMASLGQIVYVQFGYDFMNYTLSSEYGTICIPTAAALPTGVEAYTCDGIIGTVLNLVKVTALEAYTPYILKKTGSDASYNILTTVKTTNETYTSTSGLLNGVLAPVTAPEGSYVLQNLEKIGFYKVASELTVPANRCYLTVPAGGGIKEAYYFNEDDATGIKTLSNSPLKGENIYNLAGQRMSKMQKGVNIINGKKILK
ncbi:MAG: calycin-like domain-containing protein [Bacteroidaceae bacterium]|nr:calycin-like domain-containing protein [Bacteroidaceae bacterium]